MQVGLRSPQDDDPDADGGKSFDSVPMLTSSAIVVIGVKPAMAAVTVPVRAMTRTGVPVRAFRDANIGGNSPSRDIARSTRVWP